MGKPTKLLQNSLLALALCTAPGFYGQSTDAHRSLDIAINPVFNGEKLVLETQKYLGPMGDTLQFERLRFYLSSFEVIFHDGAIYHEKDSYHLVDAENEGSLKFSLKDVPIGRIVAIKFNIGVDSIKSVSGALDGDLDPRHGMYWAWNSGYINAKLEGRSRSCKTHQNRFEFHIGGYSYPQNALRKVELDLNPGQSTYFEGSHLLLTAEIQSWFDGIELNKFKGVMIPGKEAMQVADNYSRMFKVSFMQ